MFSDVHMLLAWFGFMSLMLLFKVPFIVAGGRSRLGHWVHSLHLFPSGVFQRRVGYRR